MFADQFAKRIRQWSNGARHVEVWRRWDGMFRVIQTDPIGGEEPYRRFRETRGETVDNERAARELADQWEKETFK